ncbi:peptidoglycan N-acetylmuramoylhydrolase [Pandoraea horticolens]|uniref:Peptidoglycan N-acetylmuramoylhydrolase n=1 Tax=Pandoraea horticolens TaxID=2508298 RepID=A0A5E4YL29_9BURK|nr:lytic transglycosylase domain-containing protein [Pandoraea horticolens]VVE49115.1 peptidoglycan N-acetylmuramoylhydrolase [Pandoraea horticolens]
MSVSPGQISRRRSPGRKALRRVLIVLSMLGLSMPAFALNRALLPLHPRVADAQLLVPEPRAAASPARPPAGAGVAPDVRLASEPEAPGTMRESAPAAPASTTASASAFVPAQASARASALPPAQTPMPATQTLPFDSLVRRAAEVASVDAALLHAIIDVESGYDPQALSGRGAIGLMQVLPGTGERFGVRRLEDPAENVRAGAAYIRWLLSRFDGDLSLVLAAYNAGEGAVLRYGRQIPPFPETQNYVRKVMAGYSRLRATNAPQTAATQRDPVPPRRSTPRPAVREIATIAAEAAPHPKAVRAEPPARTAGTDEVTADRAWHLLRGLGTLLTRSPSVEAAGGHGRDRPAVLMP